LNINSIVTIAVVAASSVTGVSAATVSNSTGLTAPATTITFSEVSGVSAGSVVTDQFAAYGATFGSLSASEGLYFGNSGNPGAGLLNYFPDTYNPFSIKFSGVVTEAAFNMITNGYTDKFTALLNGAAVESFTTTTGGWKYYGFTGILFDEIQVEIGFGSTATNKHMRLDNLQMGAINAVPLPAGGLLLLSGLVGVAAVKRRKSRVP
jgi:hypothetical protein